MFNVDISLYPCCTFEVPPVLGNIEEKSIVDIRNGKMNEFRWAMLHGVEHCGEVCANCKAYLYNMFLDDVITDKDAIELMNEYCIE